MNTNTHAQNVISAPHAPRFDGIDAYKLYIDVYKLYLSTVKAVTYATISVAPQSRKSDVKPKAEGKTEADRGDAVRAWLEKFPEGSVERAGLDVFVDTPSCWATLGENLLKSKAFPPKKLAMQFPKFFTAVDLRRRKESANKTAGVKVPKTDPVEPAPKSAEKKSYAEATLPAFDFDTYVNLVEGSASLSKEGRAYQLGHFSAYSAEFDRRKKLAKVSPKVEAQSSTGSRADHVNQPLSDAPVTGNLPDASEEDTEPATISEDDDWRLTIKVKRNYPTEYTRRSVYFVPGHAHQKLDVHNVRYDPESEFYFVNPTTYQLVPDSKCKECSKLKGKGK